MVYCKMEKKTFKSGKSEYKKLIIALLVLFLIAGTFIIYLSWPLLTGKTIVVATRPVDPFDMFRGQYIVINYEISQIPAIAEAKEGDSVYVSLKEDETNVWRYDFGSLTKPAEGTFIKGRIRWVSDSSMSVEYGVEQFFFESKASFPTTNMTVELKVSASGQARISNLLHNGQPIEMTYQNLSLTS
jgi:uncharacterized membrane-anchored protein